MKTTIELNEEEICQVLSEKFNVDINNVLVMIKKEEVGYGMNEHEESVIVARLFDYKKGIN